MLDTHHPTRPLRSSELGSWLAPYLVRRLRGHLYADSCIVHQSVPDLGRYLAGPDRFAAVVEATRWDRARLSYIGARQACAACERVSWTQRVEERRGFHPGLPRGPRGR